MYYYLQTYIGMCVCNCFVFSVIAICKLNSLSHLIAVLNIHVCFEATLYSKYDDQINKK